MVRRIDSLGLAQRIVLVIALAIAFAFLGRYLVSLGQEREFGWFAYAPLNSSLQLPNHGLRPWLRLVIWLALIAVWCAASVYLLRPHRASHEG